LSRQRIWGVPIPIYYSETAGEPLADYDVMMKVADVVEKGGIEAFHTTPPEHVIGKSGYKQGRDILDVWFDSGVCHAAVQNKRGYKNRVADLYLEGSDQHRGWFNTSMLSGMATTGEPPFKALITHGFVNDSQGRKMSKSLGNVVDPNEITKQSGAEIIRLWAASSDYGNDVGCGKEELTRVTEAYRKMRNTMRFLLGALSDFDFSKNAVDFTSSQFDLNGSHSIPLVDRWMMHQLNELIRSTTASYEIYEFHRVTQQLNHFFTVTLSATYMDILKDRLYTWKADGLERRAAQTVYFHVTSVLLRLMAPLTTFLAEEAYGYFSGKTRDSVLLESFPQEVKSWSQPEVHTLFEKILPVRSEVQKKLEELRASKVIGSSLEAKVVVEADGEILKALNQLNNSHKKSNLREFFIVSDIEIKNGAFKVTASKAAGDKCVRCWVFSTEISTAPTTAGICPKCVEALT
jgi:isoleucyl-tRNA synthetase